MEAPEGPLRFQCPPDFSAGSFCPGAPFSPETLQAPSKELWLIRAPASFSPESLDGHSVPLLGFQTLKASQQPGGTEKIFHVQTALEHLGGAHLLLPSGHRDRLTCSPPFSGSLSICERYGDSSSNQPLFPVAARPAPRIPAGLKQRFLPFGNHPERAPLSGAVEEPPRKKKKKKKKHRLGEEDSEDQLPLFGMPLGETTGAGETEDRGQHKVDGAAPLAVGSQPGSAAVAQNGVLSGEPEELAPLIKKKKKKRKEDRELKEEMGGEAEAGHQHENGAAPLAIDSQPSSAADAQNGLLSGEAEEPGTRSKKKKKTNKRKDDREVKEEMGEEAEAPHQQKEDGAVSPSMPEAQPNSAAFAHDGLLSGEAEAASPRSKKKKKRKEDRKLKEETRGEAEAAAPHQADGTTPWAIGFQPNPAAVAQDGLLSGEAEDLAPLSKKKKKEDGELKEGTGEEAEATHPHREDGTAALWGIGSQPDSKAVAQDGLLSGRAEDPGPKSKKKKKRKEDRDMKEETGIETEAAHPHKENGTTPWVNSSQPSSRLIAHDSLLSGEAEDPASISKKKKKKKRKEGQSVKEETGGEAEGLPDLSSWLGGGSEPQIGEDSLPGMEEMTQSTHKGKRKEKAASLGPFSSQEDTAEVLRDFSGPGPTPEDGLVLAEEEPGAGSSRHKAKKKKRKKEKEKLEEAAQELEGWPAQQGVESWTELGTPLGGGGGQEAEPGREELSQKRKKKEHHRRQAGLEKEVGNS